MRILRMSIGFVLLLLMCGDAVAQALPVPVVKSDVRMQAKRATLVQGEGSKLLLLEGDVSVSVGGYAFRDQNAIVRITREPGIGKPLRRFAFVFDRPESVGVGGVQANGKNLLVTVSSTGRVLFDLGVEAPQLVTVMPETPFTRQAMQRLGDFDERANAPLLAVPDEPALTPEQRELREARRQTILQQRREIVVPKPGQAAVDDELVDRPILPVRGTVRYGPIERFDWDRSGEEENRLLLLGGVTVMYEDADEGRDVVLSADKVVIFLAKGDDDSAIAPQSFGAGRVRGVYLEDNVEIRDGTTTVRSPRAFYDLQTGRAVLLDAVIYNVDVRYRVPLYVRADVVRQTSADTFLAEEAVFTTSEFAKPHLAIGASRITLQRLTNENGQTESWVTADDVTLNANGTPFFYWPSVTAEAGSIPIRRVKVGFDSANGGDIQTAWDLLTLAGVRAPEGVELLGNVDVRGEHGLALGADLKYDRETTRGDARAYFLPSDSGNDEIAERTNVGFDSETRGFFRLRHRQVLPAGWELWLEGSYVSDPTFLEEFFPDQAYAEDAYETSVYFKKAEDEWALTGLIKGQTDNFLPQYGQLLTPGYAVNKLPEAEYRLMTSVFDDVATLYHETRVGRMRAMFGNDSPGDRGFTAAQSAAAFGIAPGTSFDAAAIAASFPRQLVTRADSRTELAAPFRAGAIDLMPFAVGRITAYDDDFASFNGGNNDQVRLWGGLGVRASTQLSNTYNAFASPLLDAQGLRHIVEPGVTVAFYDNTVNASDLPIYDPEVERLTEGVVTRIGVTNTLQTRRGGPGRSRTIDWIRLRTDLVLVTEDSANPMALGRYYDYRPEYTLGNDHFYTELMWAVTEATAFTGELTHHFDQNAIAQWRAGIENRHTDRLSSAISYREIDPLDARLLSYGLALQLTNKYRMGLYQVIDFGEGDSRTINIELDRRIPRATLGLVLGYDDIDGSGTVSIVLTPDGTNGGLGADGLFSGGFFGP